MSEEQMGASASADRATRASTEPASGLGHSAGIPSADDVRLLHAGPDARGGFAFTFADGNENGVIHMLAEHLYGMMGIGTPHELNCVQMDLQPRDFGQRLTLTLQKEGGKTPLASKAEAIKLLRQTLEAIESGRHEPLAIMRDAIRNWLADDVTAQAMSAREGQDPQGLGAEPASAAPKGCAQP